MPRPFDPIGYVMQVGQELVLAFQGGGFATTPGQIGSAREHPLRRRFKHLLPGGVGIGSGCIIDSFGNTSKQMDVVLYEEDLCPVFSVNEDPAATYYPCEGVIATGEVKSVLDSRELEDTFRKIASVKRLRRYAQLSPSGRPGMADYVAFRKYGSPNSAVTPSPGDYNQDLHPSDQIYGFSLVGRLELAHETLCNKFIELSISDGHALSPNLVVSMDGNILSPLSIPPNRHNPSITVSVQEANSIYVVMHPNRSFAFLLARLQAMYTTGRTVDVHAFDRYFAEEGVLSLPSDGVVKPLPSSG